MFRLDKKVAIITGASRGIGEAIAMGFVEHGAKVVLASRKLDDLKKVEERVKAAGGTALAIACHTGKPDEVKALVDRTVAELGGVDVLVNNAATNPYFGPLAQTPDAAFDKTFEVNVKGYFYAMREVVRHMTDRGQGGSIINISSINALRAAPMQGVYGMTKAALISMTQTLALELGGANIRVNAIAPGLVETRFASTIINSEMARSMFTDRTPLGRHAQPIEIVGAAIYLASNAASFVTGQTLVVDGGRTST